jgi:hypothetical protein
VVGLTDNKPQLSGSFLAVISIPAPSNSSPTLTSRRRVSRRAPASTSRSWACCRSAWDTSSDSAATLTRWTASPVGGADAVDEPSTALPARPRTRRPTPRDRGRATWYAGCSTRRRELRGRARSDSRRPRAQTSG